ncbi:MAG: hypothetical protein F4086_17685 [Gemmatimonadetes bacterium]|nr:hypothetical protein [Gammaproteobacteria bacterium]MYE95459.1 hypothetical protein [Gemmatimonadota bacterium]MYJ12138.1 hypothetical protein [Gemmatimonadota bacterium]
MADSRLNTGWMVAWQPAEADTPGKILVAPHPDYEYRTSSYLLTSDGTESLEHLEEREQAARLIGAAFQCVTDGVPIADVLREFGKIPEWHTMPFPTIHGWVERATYRGEWNPHNPS